VAGAAGILCAVVAIVSTWRIAPYPLWVWLPVQLAGLSFVLSGVVLWLRRPTNGTGRLMIAVGLTSYIGDLQLSSAPVLFAIGFCCYHLTYAVLGHLVLALPTGRLHRAYERRLVALQYAAPPITQGARYLAEYPPQPQSWGNPHATYSVWAAVGSVTMLVLTGLTVLLVVLRWSAAGPPIRRQYALVWMTILGIGSAVAFNALAALSDAAATAQRDLLLAYAIGLIATPIALAGGLLRVRMARVRVADLVMRLEGSAEPEHVRASIADALGDPNLDLWFTLPDENGQVRTDGRGGELLHTADRTITPVLRRGQRLAVLVHDPALREQRPLIDSVLAAARLALDNSRLLLAERTQLEEVRRSRARILIAADTERRRIQRDLHDGVQHKLLVISMLVEQARDAVARDRALPGGCASARGLEAAAAQLREVVRELRELTEGIYPPALAEQGLAAAVEMLAERAPLPVRANVPARRWAEHVERAAYFVITEALANVYKHANATSAHVRVSSEAHRLIVDITDDGVGGADLARGTGLRGLQDRVAALNGLLRVHSPPQSGTQVVAELPCES
jgi:signal transduction histidine kinase